MITTLDEAIAHANEVAKKNKNLAKTYESFKDYGNPKSSITSGHKRCLECATEHEQLAALLTELQERREADRWIPVSERLPEGMGTYLVTLEYKEHGKGVTTLWYHGKQIGWDLRVADVVIAWQPLPKPYTESEAENE